MRNLTVQLIFALLMALGTGGRPLAAPASANVTVPSTSSTEEKALYLLAHQALSEGDWSTAAWHFATLVRKLNGGEGTDASLYWQAYALTRSGRGAEAQPALRRLQAEYPGSRWIAQASRLQGAARDEEALLAVLHLPADQAVAQLAQRLQSGGSEQDRRRALFVLSQIDSPKAIQQLTQVASGKDSALAGAAVHLLGVAGAAPQLQQIYAASTDPATRQRVLNALGVAGASPALEAAAREDAAVSVRRTAIRALGVAGDADALARIASDDGNLQVRRDAIKALGVAGGYEQLLVLYPSVARSALLRAETISALQMADADGGALLSLYQAAKTPEEKQALLRALKSDAP